MQTSLISACCLKWNYRDIPTLWRLWIPVHSQLIERKTWSTAGLELNVAEIAIEILARLDDDLHIEVAQPCAKVLSLYTLVILGRQDYCVQRMHDSP